MKKNEIESLLFAYQSVSASSFKRDFSYLHKFEIRYRSIHKYTETLSRHCSQTLRQTLFENFTLSTLIDVEHILTIKLFFASLLLSHALGERLLVHSNFLSFRLFETDSELRFISNNWKKINFLRLSLYDHK